MQVNIDTISKTLAVVSSFIATLKVVNSVLLKAIENQKERDIPKFEEIDINVFNEMKYYDIFNPNELDETGKNNLKNSLIFRKITNKSAPIHIVNRIFNCYNPAEAIYIYSRATKYISFNQEGGLEKPKILKVKYHKALLNILLILALTSLAINILLIFLCTQFLLIVINNFDVIQSAASNSTALILSLLLFFSVVTYVSTFFSLRMLDDSLSGLRLYRKATDFYSS